MFMRVASTRSLHSSPSLDRDSLPTEELPRLGTAQAAPPVDGLVAPPMPSAYSMSDSLPSGSQLGLKLGSRSLSALFRDASESRVEQNFWSLDDDAASSSSGEQSVNSPARADDANAAQGSLSEAPHHHGLIFPPALLSPDAVVAVAANPFATESPFYDLSDMQRSRRLDGSAASLAAHSSTQEASDSTNGSVADVQVWLACTHKNTQTNHRSAAVQYVSTHTSSCVSRCITPAPHSRLHQCRAPSPVKNPPSHPRCRPAAAATEVFAEPCLGAPSGPGRC